MEIVEKKVDDLQNSLQELRQKGYDESQHKTSTIEQRLVNIEATVKELSETKQSGEARLDNSVIQGYVEKAIDVKNSEERVEELEKKRKEKPM